MYTEYMNGNHFMGGMGLFGPVMMIFWIAIIVAVIVLLVRWLGGSGHKVKPPISLRTDLPVGKQTRLNSRPANSN